MEASSHKAPIVLFEEFTSLPAPHAPGARTGVRPSEASVLYIGDHRPTQGLHAVTTARARIWTWYATRGHLASFRQRVSGFITPCPCITSTRPFVVPLRYAQRELQIQATGFIEPMVAGVCQTQATIVHYLG